MKNNSNNGDNMKTLEQEFYEYQRTHKLLIEHYNVRDYNITFVNGVPVSADTPNTLFDYCFLKEFMRLRGATSNTLEIFSQQWESSQEVVNLL